MAKYYLFCLLLALKSSFAVSYIVECNYNNCIDCTWSFGCKWMNNKCQPANYLMADDWIKDIKNCLVNNIEENSMPYCKNHLNTKPPAEFSLDNAYLQQETELFCIWQFNELNTFHSVRFALNNYRENANDKNVLLLSFKDNTTRLFMTELMPGYNLLVENVVGYSFVFYSKKVSSNSQSFVFSVLYSTNYLKTFFVILGIVGFSALLFGLGAFFLLRYLKKRKAPSPQQEPNAVGGLPQSRELLKQIAAINNKKLLEEALKQESFGSLPDREEKEICTICFETFVKEAKVVVLSCKHLFHFDCIHTWSVKEVLNPRCPNCNKDIIPLKDIDDSQNPTNPFIGAVPISIFNQNSVNVNINSSHNMNEVLRLHINRSSASHH